MYVELLGSKIDVLKMYKPAQQVVTMVGKGTLVITNFNIRAAKVKANTCWFMHNLCYQVFYTDYSQPIHMQM